ncbi:hypothetical protein Pmar_PMAR009980 [Perkinsus marinus ATCC 50983]|uniref:Uncharacterized protein n=1 Tax=Perkinsus marinus (strain ATCC 50983 / TXsc) TaxID=423536 RepID=C5L2S3_PERM5|nr:hypothetical protein Pmar_PMAR009980 [Perkinsus marinus ATCC 50983]EER08988.1 hypothetical protein Pmar_PMAR009980 [Perkinsus marinus ATCC 50983]|eukprot:XP_002777172.1 hypothetical protein Pmar_PMAR009980 [Perkinsus marinus ATCC 50983]
MPESPFYHEQYDSWPCTIEMSFAFCRRYPSLFALGSQSSSVMGPHLRSSLSSSLGHRTLGDSLGSVAEGRLNRVGESESEDDGSMTGPPAAAASGSDGLRRHQA